MTIIVVGAGIVGCAIACELASRGARVRVIDPRGVGAGATRASAGILAPLIEGHSADLRRLAVCSLSLYDEFIARLRRGSDRQIEYERTGTLQVALSAGEGDALAAQARELSGAGVPHTLLDAAAARRLEPSLSPAAAAALLVPEHGYVSAGMLIAALADAAEKYGATFETGLVVDVAAGTGGPRVETPAGVFESDAVVVAAGSWSGQLARARRRAAQVKPIRGQLLHLALDRRAASRVIWGTQCYAVPWRDGTVLVGATVEDVGFDETATVEGVRFLVDAAAELMPALGAARFREVRVGLRPRTPDELPIIGRSATIRAVSGARSTPLR